MLVTVNNMYSAFFRRLPNCENDKIKIFVRLLLRNFSIEKMTVKET